MSHVLGALMALVALAVLMQRARQRGMTGHGLWALALYGLSMVLGFTASAMFHAPILSTEDLILYKKLDHAAIFLMIAGTGTALYGAMHARWARPMIGALWAICLGALAIKMMIWPMPLWLTAVIYVSVGWCALIGLFVIIQAVGWRRLRPLFWGAAVLTVGAVMFATELPVVWPGVVEGHEVFHVLSLVGAGIHFWFIYETCTEPGAFAIRQAPFAHGQAASMQVIPLLSDEG